MSISDKDRQRLVIILGMLGSAHDGEVLNAAKQAHRVVSAMKLSWSDVLDNAGCYTREQVQEVADLAYTRGLEEGKAVGRARVGAPLATKEVAGGPGSCWNKLARAFLDGGDLSAWETEFFEDWATNAYSPTEKQRSIFRRLCERYGEEYPGRF